MTLPTVATIVVTYNSAHFIAHCLGGIRASSMPSRLVVVDNASSDDTVGTVKAEAPDALIHVNTDNLGFAAACNQGMDRAADSAPDYYFFVNPDATVDRGCLEELVVALEAHPQAAVASPLILESSSGVIWYAGARMDLESCDFGHRAWGDRDIGQFVATEETGRPTGCAMLVRREAVDTVGPLDPSFFLYWEECEWMLRFRNAGFTALFVPRARAEHEVSSTTGGVGSKYYEYYYLRNRLRFIHDTTRRSRVELVYSVGLESMRRDVDTFRAWGWRAGVATARAMILAHWDFWRQNYGKSRWL